MDTKDPNHLLHQKDTNHKIPDTISAIIEYREIREALSAHSSDLDELITAGFTTVGLKEEMNETLTEILNGNMNNGRIADYYHAAFFSHNIATREKGLIQLAIIHTTAAEAALNSNEISYSWNALLKAGRYLSYYEGFTDLTIRARKTRAETGGAAKQKNITTLNNLIIKLLTELKPKKGWRIPNDAANTIIDTLYTLAKKENLTLPEDRNDLIHKIINLINEDNDATKAFGQS
jgi:hypothetical protein